MKKFLTLASAALISAMTASAAGNLQVTFNGTDNANWTANESAVVANGHLYVEMDLQANEKYRTDLKFASNDDPITLSAETDQLLAIKFIGARPNGNMTLEFKNTDGTWYNTKWRNSPQGTVGTPGGNSIYYYELTRDENYTGTISIVNLNIKIADCAAEPYNYTIDWIATYPSVDAINADVAWADDGAKDNDEQIDYSKAVLYSTITGNTFADLGSAIESAVDDDQIVINQPVELKDRMSIGKNITFVGANDGITITRNFKNKLFLIVNKGTEVRFENVAFDSTEDDGKTAFIENNGKLNLDNVTFNGIKTNHNQGVIAIKQGGRLTANNVKFDDCEVTDADGHLSTIFVGTNCTVFINGDCGASSVYIEKANGKIEAGDITNEAPIVITLGDMANRELGSVVVKDCNDPSKFSLKDSKYVLAVQDDDLVLAEFSGISTVDAENVEAEYYTIMGVKIDKPTPGIYLMKKNGKVTKVLVK